MMSGLRLILSRLIIVLLLAGVFGGGFVLGERKGRETGAPGTSSDFAIFWRVHELLQRDFIGNQPSLQEQVYGAAEGLTKSYNDPYTAFLRPEPRRLERDELRGHFGGIGAYMSRNEQGDLVLTVMRDRPAARAGIQDGDVLLAVDDKPVTPEMSVQDVVLWVRGEVGTTVKLTLRRGANAAPWSVNIVRERIETPSVEWRLLDGEQHIGYLRIRIFGERTSEELRTGLADLQRQGAQKLILDLRGNGGGLVDAAVEITSQLLEDGVVLRELRRGIPERFYPVKKVSSPAHTWPIVLLVDGGTASASEIVAGALRDYGRGILVGEKTFGKGSVQEVHELSDGSSLHVTVARWLTPERHELDKIGLKPDIEVGITESDRNAGRDPQLARALAWLRGEH